MRPVLTEFLKYIEDYIPEDILKKEKLMPLKEAIELIHFPIRVEDPEQAKNGLVRRTFLLQLKAIHKKWLWQHDTTSKIKRNAIDKEHLATLLEKLPFKLTGAQQNTHRNHRRPGKRYSHGSTSYRRCWLQERP